MLTIILIHLKGIMSDFFLVNLLDRLGLRKKLHFMKIPGDF